VPEQPSFDGAPLSSAIFRLARAHKGLATRLLRDAGLRPGQELVLMTLWQHGPQRQVDLINALDSDAPTMARSIARLEKSGLVTRRTSPTDRRAVIVTASDASLALRDKVKAAWATLEHSTVGSLPGERQQAALRLFAALEMNLAAATRGEGPSPLARRCGG
jgi:DNA-binding MarR family transcriptional regulator